MITIIKDINSDKKNCIRHLKTLFNSLLNTNVFNDNNKAIFQSNVSNYITRLTILLNSISNNNDYRIFKLNNDFNEIIEYVSKAVSLIKVTNSIYLLNDISNIVIQFIERKYSDLLKIEVVNVKISTI